MTFFLFKANKRKFLIEHPNTFIWKFLELIFKIHYSKILLLNEIIKITYVHLK